MFMLKVDANIYGCMHRSMRVCMWYVRLRVYVRMGSWVGLRVEVIRTSSMRSRPVTRDLKLCRYGPDKQAIQ